MRTWRKHGQDEAARYLAPFLLVLLIFAARGKRDEYTIQTPDVAKTCPSRLGPLAKTRLKFVPYYVAASAFCSVVIIFSRAAMTFRDTFIFYDWYSASRLCSSGNWTEIGPLKLKCYLLWSALTILDSGMTYIVAGIVLGCLVAGSFEFAAKRAGPFQIDNVSMLSFASYSAALFGWILVTTPVSAPLVNVLGFR